MTEGLSFTNDLMLDNSLILLPQSAPVTAELKKALAEWEFTDVYCEGNISLGGEISSGEEDAGAGGTKQGGKIGESVRKALENSKNIRLSNSDKSRMEIVQGIYNEYMNYINSLFTHFSTHGDIDQKELSETVKDLCIFIKENRRYILRINPAQISPDLNFLVTHSMRSTVLALSIGLQLHLPLSKMIDLGTACILHEIGMLRIPPQIYMTDRRLLPGEKAQILKHPIFGYTIAKDLDFPLSVQLGILEHHEKENGTGYPRRLSGDKITTIAKIISVACSFEAITSPRQYKEERSTFDAMVEILKNQNHQYDDSVIKALLYSISLFPIGAYVYLRNGKIALVTDVTPDNPKCPVVQMLTEKSPDGSPKTVQTDNGQNQILRVLSKREQEDALKAAAEVNKAAEERQAAAETAEKQAAQTAPAVKASGTQKNSDSDTEEIDISFFD